MGGVVETVVDVGSSVLGGAVDFVKETASGAWDAIKDVADAAWKNIVVPALEFVFNLLGFKDRDVLVAASQTTTLTLDKDAYCRDCVTDNTNILPVSDKKTSKYKFTKPVTGSYTQELLEYLNKKRDGVVSECRTITQHINDKVKQNNTKSRYATSKSFIRKLNKKLGYDISFNTTFTTIDIDRIKYIIKYNSKYSLFKNKTILTATVEFPSTEHLCIAYLSKHNSFSDNTFTYDGEQVTYVGYDISLVNNSIQIYAKYKKSDDDTVYNTSTLVTNTYNDRAIVIKFTDYSILIMDLNTYSSQPKSPGTYKADIKDVIFPIIPIREDFKNANGVDAKVYENLADCISKYQSDPKQVTKKCKNNESKLSKDLKYELKYLGVSIDMLTSMVCSTGAKDIDGAYFMLGLPLNVTFNWDKYPYMIHMVYNFIEFVHYKKFNNTDDKSKFDAIEQEKKIFIRTTGTFGNIKVDFVNNLLMDTSTYYLKIQNKKISINGSTIKIKPSVRYYIKFEKDSDDKSIIYCIKVINKKYCKVVKAYNLIGIQTINTSSAYPSKKDDTDNNVDVLFVPVFTEMFKGMKGADIARAIDHCRILQIHAAKLIHLKWYETPEFTTFMQFVGIVFTIVTLGAGSWVWAAISTGECSAY